MAMWRYAFFIAGLAAIVALSACATLSKAECQTGDWRGIGFADGNRGEPLSRIEDHMEACSEHGIAVDRQLYEAGRKEGLETYCRIDRAESEGRKGRPYHNVCEGETGVSFLAVYDEARDVHAVERDLQLVRSRLDTLIEQITASGLSKADRAGLRLEISTQQDRIRVLEDRIRLEEKELRFTYQREQARLANR